MPRSQLVELYAHGLGVIDDARLEFGPGFNVITGETGAGKTLLLGALNLCLGGDGPTTRRADVSEVVASAVFVRDDASEVVLARELTASGRLRSAVNGAPSSAEALRTLADGLIVIHGQHDSLTLRSRARVLKILDASGGVSSQALDDVRRRLAGARRLRDELGGDESRRSHDIEYMEFQIGDLEGAKMISPSELSDALEELTRLTELRDAQAALSTAITELDGEDDDSILSRLARVIAQMPAGESLSSPRLQLRDALDQAREVVRELSSLADPDSLDPETSRQLEDRVSQLQQIARKYGGTVSSALEALEQLRATRQSRLDDAVRLVALDEEIERLDAREHQLALEVRAQRESAARQLNEALKSQLPRVALSQATLRFEIDGEDGSRVTILFSANRGQREGPVEALASGGELSRVLLALSLETVEDGKVTVFDEVDAGVGGQVAQQIGECLQEVGRRQQVLAVTHLATVAARADHHFVIKKIVKDHTTSTIVRSVAGDERITEIARMLAGDEITRESKALALQLLETAR